MSTDKKSRRICKRPAFLIPCVVLLLILSVLCFLRFGNPQWYKRIYIFQAYVWPKHADKGATGWIQPPANYTGLWYAWHPDGEKWVKARFVNGKQHGMLTTWHKNGRKAQEANYKDDKKHGILICWHTNGEKVSECDHKNGRVHGTSTAYTNAQKVFERNYKDGVPHGTYTEWHKNGQICLQAEFENGKPHGAATYWDEKGNIIKVEHYENDKLIRTETPHAEPANPADREGAAADL